MNERYHAERPWAGQSASAQQNQRHSSWNRLPYTADEMHPVFDNTHCDRNQQQLQESYSGSRGQHHASSQYNFSQARRIERFNDSQRRSDYGCSTQYSGPYSTATSSQHQLPLPESYRPDNLSCYNGRVDHSRQKFWSNPIPTDETPSGLDERVNLDFHDINKVTAGLCNAYKSVKPAEPESDDHMSICSTEENADVGKHELADAPLVVDYNHGVRPLVPEHEEPVFKPVSLDRIDEYQCGKKRASRSWLNDGDKLNEIKKPRFSEQPGHLYENESFDYCDSNNGQYLTTTQNDIKDENVADDMYNVNYEAGSSVSDATCYDQPFTSLENKNDTKSQCQVPNDTHQVRNQQNTGRKDDVNVLNNLHDDTYDLLDLPNKETETNGSYSPRESALEEEFESKQPVITNTELAVQPTVDLTLNVEPSSQVSATNAEVETKVSEGSSEESEDDPEHVQSQLYMGNLARKTSKSEVRRMFSDFPSAEVWMADKKSGSGDVCAFVKLKSLKEAKQYLAGAEECMLRGKRVECRFVAAQDFDDYRVRKAGDIPSKSSKAVKASSDLPLATKPNSRAYATSSTQAVSPTPSSSFTPAAEMSEPGKAKVSGVNLSPAVPAPSQDGQKPGMSRVQKSSQEMSRPGSEVKLKCIASRFNEYIDKVCPQAPLIGLRYIAEYLGPSSCVYMCTLCKAKFSDVGIAKHLISLQHRMNFFEESSSRIFKELLDFAKDHKTEEVAIECAKYVAHNTVPGERPRHVTCSDPDIPPDTAAEIDLASISIEGLQELTARKEALLGNIQRDGVVGPGEKSQIDAFITQHAKQNKNNTAIVGLRYITEIVRRNEREILYVCGLCNCVTYSIHIVTHLTGHKHRIKYLEVTRPVIYAQFKPLTMQPDLQVLRSACLKVAMEIEKVEGWCQIFTITEGQRILLEAKYGPMIEDKPVPKPASFPMKPAQPEDTPPASAPISAPPTQHDPAPLDTSPTTAEQPGVPEIEISLDIFDENLKDKYITDHSEFRKVLDAARSWDVRNLDCSVEIYRKIKELKLKNDVLPGLQYITEVQNGCGQAEIKQFYYCDLCMSAYIIHAPSIVKHVKSPQHGLNVLAVTNHEIAQKLKEMTSEETRGHNLLFHLKEEQTRHGLGNVKVIKVKVQGSSSGDDKQREVTETDLKPREATGKKEDKPVECTTSRIFSLLRRHTKGKDVPIIGLGYVSEYQNQVDLSAKPRFECKLCFKDLTCDNVYQHVTGFDHNIKYVMKHNKELYTTVKNGPDTLQRYCQYIDATVTRKVTVIQVTKYNARNEPVYSFPEIVEDKDYVSPWLGKVTLDSIRATPTSTVNSPEKSSVKPCNTTIKTVKEESQKVVFNWNTDYSAIQEKISNQSIVKCARRSKFLSQYGEKSKTQALIGLEELTEFQQPDITVEPWYLCHQCRQRLAWPDVFSHVISRNHRLTYMMKNYKYLYELATVSPAGADSDRCVDKYSMEIQMTEGNIKGPTVMMVLNIDQEAIRCALKAGAKKSSEGGSSEGSRSRDRFGRSLPTDRQRGRDNSRDGHASSRDRSERRRSLSRDRLRHRSSSCDRKGRRGQRGSSGDRVTAGRRDNIQNNCEDKYTTVNDNSALKGVKDESQNDTTLNEVHNKANVPEDRARYRSNTAMEQGRSRGKNTSKDEDIEKFIEGMGTKCPAGHIPRLTTGNENAARQTAGSTDKRSPARRFNRSEVTTSATTRHADRLVNKKNRNRAGNNDRKPFQFTAEHRKTESQQLNKDLLGIKVSGTARVGSSYERCHWESLQVEDQKEALVQNRLVMTTSPCEEVRRGAGFETLEMLIDELPEQEKQTLIGVWCIQGRFHPAAIVAPVYRCFRCCLLNSKYAGDLVLSPQMALKHLLGSGHKTNIISRHDDLYTEMTREMHGCSRPAKLRILDTYCQKLTQRDPDENREFTYKCTSEPNCYESVYGLTKADWAKRCKTFLDTYKFTTVRRSLKGNTVKPVRIRGSRLYDNSRQGEVLVKFAHVNSLADFYLVPVNMDESYTELFEELTDEYFDSEANLDIQWLVGDTCIAWSREKYHRATITKIIQTRPMVEILRIDDGITDLVPMEDLREIQQRHTSLPQFALHCRLDNVSHMGIEDSCLEHIVRNYMNPDWLMTIYRNQVTDKPKVNHDVPNDKLKVTLVKTYTVDLKVETGDKKAGIKPGELLSTVLIQHKLAMPLIPSSGPCRTTMPDAATSTASNTTNFPNKPIMANQNTCTPAEPQDLPVINPCLLFGSQNMEQQQMPVYSIGADTGPLNMGHNIGFQNTAQQFESQQINMGPPNIGSQNPDFQLPGFQQGTQNCFQQPSNVMGGLRFAPSMPFPQLSQQPAEMMMMQPPPLQTRMDMPAQQVTMETSGMTVTPPGVLASVPMSYEAQDANMINFRQNETLRNQVNRKPRKRVSRFGIGENVNERRRVSRFETETPGYHEESSESFHWEDSRAEEQRVNERWSDTQDRASSPAGSTFSRMSLDSSPSNRSRLDYGSSERHTSYVGKLNDEDDIYTGMENAYECNTGSSDSRSRSRRSRERHSSNEKRPKIKDLRKPKKNIDSNRISKETKVNSGTQVSRETTKAKVSQTNRARMNKETHAGGRYSASGHRSLSERDRSSGSRDRSTTKDNDKNRETRSSSKDSFAYTHNKSSASKHDQRTSSDKTTRKHNFSDSDPVTLKMEFGVAEGRQLPSYHGNLAETVCTVTVDVGDGSGGQRVLDLIHNTDDDEIQMSDSELQALEDAMMLEEED